MAIQMKKLADAIRDIKSGKVRSTVKTLDVYKEGKVNQGADYYLDISEDENWIYFSVVLADRTLVSHFMQLHREEGIFYLVPGVNPDIGFELDAQGYMVVEQ